MPTKNKTDSSSPDSITESDELFRKTRNALGKNLFAVFEVAGTSKNENVERLTVMALHKKTGIARDAIHKYMNTDNSKAVSNPDLEKICQLASALNISPAFLLMSSDDWRRLIEAITTMQNTVWGNKVLSESVMHAIEIDKKTAGLELIKRLGTYPEKLNTDENIQKPEVVKRMQDIDRINEIKKSSILAMTAVAQNYLSTAPANSSQKAKVATLTTLAAIFGASVQIK